MKYCTSGTMASYKVADANTEAAWNAAASVSGSTGAIISDLAEGDYVVTELAVEGMNVSDITGGKLTGETGQEHNDANTTARTVTVHVTAGDTTATGDGATTTYTNNRILIDIKVIKINEDTRTNATPTKLGSAEFQLYKYTGSTYTVYPDEAGSKKTTSSEAGDGYGTLTFNGLPDGQYKLVETKSPDGFVKQENNDIYFDVVNGVVTRYVGAYTGTARDTEAPIKESDVVIGESSEVAQITYTKATDAVEADPEHNVEAQDAAPATFTVGNTPGAALPNTGGPGTNLIYLIGSILLAFAGGGLLMRRKRRVAGN